MFFLRLIGRLLYILEHFEEQVLNFKPILLAWKRPALPFMLLPQITHLRASKAVVALFKTDNVRKPTNPALALSLRIKPHMIETIPDRAKQTNKNFQ
jgi:hypothetical protein